MRLSFPLAIVLALLANLVPTFGRVPNPQPASNDAPPQPRE
jgi:hypothetical protein